MMDDRTYYDLVIENGLILSFLPQSQIEHGSIGISNGKIKKIITYDERLKRPIYGKYTIDAIGKIVAPGFIDFHSHVDGNDFSAEKVALQGATTTIGGERNFDGKLVNKIEESGFLINHGFYISHSFTLRRAVGIQDPHQRATAKEIDTMVELAEKFLQSGSYGIHFGLEFVPGTSEEEITALAKLAKKYNRIVLVHLRKDGFEALSYFDEIIYTAQKTGASIHILHLMYMVGFPGVMEKALQKIRRARAEGIDITADTGLYGAFPSCIGASILDKGWERHYGKDISVKNLLISSGILAGQFCDEEKFEYLREEFPNTLITVFACSEEEIDLVLKEPYVYVSTNAADGPHYENIGHPETVGTFPKLIGRYVREKNILTLGEAIGKITYEPAKRFGVMNKGNIKEGYDADLVIFDANKMKANSNYVGKGDPNASPDGIDYVIVNGEIIVQGKKVLLEKKMGRLLRKQT